MAVAGPVGAAGSPGAAAGSPGAAKEVADPLEASSYPAPPSVKHKPAATPARAGEEVVAAGAPSDAEVRQELAQMHAAERTALANSSED